MRAAFLNRSVSTSCWRNFASVIMALLMCCCLGACYSPPKGAEVVKFDPAVQEQLSIDFKRAFIEYWAARARLDWGVIYSMEAPHVRWAYSQEKFMQFRAKAPKATSVVVKNLKKLTDNSYRISAELTLKDPVTGKEEVVFPEEIWVRINGKWWHVWRLGWIEKFV